MGSRRLYSTDEDLDLLALETDDNYEELDDIFFLGSDDESKAGQYFGI